MKKKNRLVAVLLACCATVCSFSTALQAGAVNLHDEATMTEEEKQIKELCDIVVSSVNAERAKEGLSELATFPLLNELACIRAEEISPSPSKQYFTHTRPDGSNCFSLLKAEKDNFKYSTSGENIAAGRADPVSTVQQWMNSQGHRDNILNDKFTHIGIGSLL